MFRFERFGFRFEKFGFRFERFGFRRDDAVFVTHSYLEFVTQSVRKRGGTRFC